MGRQPTTDADFRAFCHTGRGWVFAKVNHRLHKASCPLLPYAYSTDKLLWEWEALAQVTAYANRHRQGWEFCPHCCPMQHTGDAQTQDAVRRARQQRLHELENEAAQGAPPPRDPTPLQRAYAVFHLTETASLDIAEAAYRAVMKAVHPDKGGSHQRAQEATAAIEIIRQHCRQRQHAF